MQDLACVLEISYRKLPKIFPAFNKGWTTNTGNSASILRHILSRIGPLTQQYRDRGATQQPEAGTSKNYCVTNSGSPEVELRFCPLFTLFKY